MSIKMTNTPRLNRETIILRRIHNALDKRLNTPVIPAKAGIQKGLTALDTRHDLIKDR